MKLLALFEEKILQTGVNKALVLAHINKFNKFMLELTFLKEWPKLIDW